MKKFKEQHIKKKSLREAVFFALKLAFLQKSFIHATLKKWQEEENPSQKDIELGYELAYGTMRWANSLDNQALHLTSKGHLKLKMKDRLILRMALYQCYFLNKVPLYAIISETLKLIEKYSHPSQKAFFTALLNRASITPYAISEDLSKRFSYPPFFIEKLKAHYEPKTVWQILRVGNYPAKICARIRRESPLTEKLDLILEKPFKIGRILTYGDLLRLSKTSDVYIQNVTYAYLIGKLCQMLPKPPQSILDLCASPGGKLIALHDVFPQAELFGNDVSEEKLSKMRSNFEKYDIHATFSCGLGEEYPKGKSFDFILLDVPCTNSGVFARRPEARYRLSQKEIDAVREEEWRLLKHSVGLIKENGLIGYMTCSILPDENEWMIKRAEKELGLEIVWSETVLPNLQGWDGGFCSLLRLKNV